MNLELIIDIEKRLKPGFSQVEFETWVKAIAEQTDVKCFRSKSKNSELRYKFKTSGKPGEFSASEIKKFLPLSVYSYIFISLDI